MCGLVSVSSVSSPSGFFALNLPFTPANLAERRADSTATLVIANGTNANSSDYMGIINENNANIFVQLGDNKTLQNDSAEELKANTDIAFSASFHTAT